VYEQRSLVDDGITVTRIASRGSDVALELAGCADLIVIAVRAGRAALTCRATTVELAPRDLVVIPFAESARLRWSEVTFDLYNFPLSSFVRTLGSPDGDITIRVPFLTSRSAELTALWHRLADLVTRQVLDRPEVYSRDVVRSQMTDGLTAVTVEAFGMTNQQEDERLRDEEVIRRADAFIGNHLDAPITVPDIAAAASVSVRGLQAVYQRVHGSTPIAHLRRTRLRAARSALLNPLPGTTVGAIGRRFGYSNLGRFSAHYRDEFDETPSRTLERTRARA
jgi:AraC-like DNA-binding protein